MPGKLGCEWTFLLAGEKQIPSSAEEDQLLRLPCIRVWEVQWMITLLSILQGTQESAG